MVPVWKGKVDKEMVLLGGRAVWKKGESSRFDGPLGGRPELPPILIVSYGRSEVLSIFCLVSVTLRRSFAFVSLLFVFLTTNCYSL